MILGVCIGLAGVVSWLARDRHPIRFPEDVDLTEVSTGTFTSFVDLASLEVTASREYPLTVRRRLHAVGSPGSTIAVAEEQTLTAGTVFDLSLHHVYVLDRQSMRSVADNRAYAYAAG